MTRLWGILAFGVTILLSCNEKRLEPDAPKEFKNIQSESGDQAPAPGTTSPSQEDAVAQDESVNIPVPISGTYMRGVVLDETTNNGDTTARVGIQLFHNGKAVSDNPSRYTVSVSPAQTGGDSQISVNSQPSATAGYDHIITVKGPGTDRIRSAYDTIRIYTTIVDNQDFTSASIAASVREIIKTDVPQKSVTTSTSTTTTTTVNGN